MARLSLVLFICFLFIGVYVNSRVLKSEATRMPNGDSMHDDELMELLNGSINDGDNPLQMQSLDRDTEDKKCAQVGEFCMYHWDCCSYSCLGYMKRCVSG